MFKFPFVSTALATSATRFGKCSFFGDILTCLAISKKITKFTKFLAYFYAVGLISIVVDDHILHKQSGHLVTLLASSFARPRFYISSSCYS